MNKAVFFPAVLMSVFSLLAAELATASDTDPLREAFAAIVEDLNDNKVGNFIAVVDKRALQSKILNAQRIDRRVAEQFSESFESQLESLFVAGFPRTGQNITAKLVAFHRNGDSALAVVRYDLPGYHFNYHEYQLRAGKGGSVVVEDWTDFFLGQRFSQAVSESLAMAVPDKAATRALLQPVTVTEAEAFQAAELFKAARDKKAERYFDILPELSEPVQTQRLVAITSAQLGRESGKSQHYRQALTTLATHYASQAEYASLLLDYYVPRRDFEQALQVCLRLRDRLNTDDAALSARLATLALILGNEEDAATWAEAAVAAEPGLELGWWAALRARTALERYDDAIKALIVLEKQFDHDFSGEVFERDKVLLTLQASDSYRNWAESRR